MRKNFLTFLPGAVFLIFLAVMTLVLLLSPAKAYSENEKRYLAGVPEVTTAGILEGQVQKDLENYTSDQVPGRNFFVGVNAYWNLATGRNTQQKIYHCSQGYLINAPEKLNTQLFETNLTRLNSFAAKAGIPASLVIVPSTGYLMEDVLPANHAPYPDDALFGQAQDLLKNVKLVDVRDALKQAKAEGPVCYRTDHHLTSLGNYAIYRAYQQDKGAPYTPKSDYTIRSYDGFYGTTWSGSGYWLTKPDQVETWDRGAPVKVTIEDAGASPITSDSLFFPSHLDSLDKYPIYLDGNHSLVTIENSQATGGSLLLIRDSYAHCLSTFLAGNYSKIYLIDLRYYRQSVSDFLTQHPVDELLYLYGIDSLLTDTNSAWLN